MIPQINIKIAIININPENIKVGYLGTSPVLKYSTNTGTPKIKEIIKNRTLTILKNTVGLYSLNKRAIVFNT